MVGRGIGMRRRVGREGKNDERWGERKEWWSIKECKRKEDKEIEIEGKEGGIEEGN